MSYSYDYFKEQELCGDEEEGAIDMVLDDYAIERRVYDKIKKLRMLHNIDTFYEKVGKLTKNVKSDHSLSRWSILAEARYNELLNM